MNCTVPIQISNLICAIPINLWNETSSSVLILLYLKSNRKSGMVSWGHELSFFWKDSEHGAVSWKVIWNVSGHPALSLSCTLTLECPEFQLWAWLFCPFQLKVLTCTSVYGLKLPGESVSDSKK